MTKPVFRGRAFVAVLMVIGFVLLTISGVFLYAAPHGRGAGSSAFLFLSRQEWRNVHIVFGFVFIVAGLFHVWLNRKTLMTYVRQKLIDAETQKIRFRWGLEPLAALLLGLFLMAASLVPFPPGSTLLEWREGIRMWMG